MDLIKEKWKHSDIPQYLKYIESLSKGKDKGIWEQRIVNTHLPCLAVPSTEVDKIAKQIFRGNYISYLNLWLWRNHTLTLIFGKILNQIKDFDILKKYIVPYSEKADNWSTIDSLKFKFTKENIPRFIDLSRTLILSSHTFSRRLSLIILLKLLSTTDCTDIVFEILNSLLDEKEYYVNMAGAWFLAECMIKYRNKTIEYYQHHHTNDFIINKSISKCRDSYRISQEDKDYLQGFKIKNK